MTEPNMSLSGLESWTETAAYKEYREDRGPQTVDAVLRRTKRYIRGTATEAEESKVESFISRMKANEAGAQKYGKTGVSARTASLRNWGYDPTGRFA